MTMRKLQFPDTVREALRRRYARQKKDWLDGGGDWPMTVTLGQVSESDALRQTGYVRDWIRAWQEWNGPGTLEWTERLWRTIGAQQLPGRLLLTSPEEVSAWVGEEHRWRSARDRYRRLTSRWPLLRHRLYRHFDVLADYADPDIDRLESLLDWLNYNPQSNLYPRQLPISGLDSKWLESRRGLVTDLVTAMQGNDPDGTEFHQCCGLRPPPTLVHLRILDPALRQQVGGLGDITAPIGEIAGLALSVKRLFIVENLQTGLAFEDMVGAVVVMALGYGVDILARLDWIRDAECVYWGDIDTHGFAILNRARTHLPRLKSRLMDETTLLDHKYLWVEERLPHTADTLPLLTDEEEIVYRGLKQNQWGSNVRLEQERLPWPEVWPVLKY